MLTTSLQNIPPLPDEWLRAVMYILSLVKIISTKSLSLTVPNHHVYLHCTPTRRIKYKSHARMIKRRARTRRCPRTQKVRSRRIKNALHVKFTTFQRYKYDSVWQLATLSAILTIYSALCNYYTMLFGNAESNLQPFPLINLDCKLKPPHLRWHVFQPEVITKSETATIQVL